MVISNNNGAGTNIISDNCDYESSMTTESLLLLLPKSMLAPHIDDASSDVMPEARNDETNFDHRSDVEEDVEEDDEEHLDILLLSESLGSVNDSDDEEDDENFHTAPPPEEPDIQINRIQTSEEYETYFPNSESSEHGPNPSSVKDNINTYSAVLGDTFHFIDRMKISIHNDLRVPSVCPPSSVLYYRVRAVYDVYANRIDSSGRPLLNEAAKKKFKNVLDEIVAGRASDPPGLSFYSPTYDKFGKMKTCSISGVPIFHCSRGSNLTANVHNQLLSLFGHRSIGIEVADQLLKMRGIRHPICTCPLKRGNASI